MKISEHFDIREFVPASIWNTYGANSTWFINKKLVDIAEFYKLFFLEQFRIMYPDVVDVLIVVNDYMYGGKKQYSGFRPPNVNVGVDLSDHKRADAFDCEIYIVFKNGTKKEVDYVVVHQIIQKNERLFLSKGVTAIEDVSIATGWLHTSVRWILNQTKILIVKPKTS